MHIVHVNFAKGFRGGEVQTLNLIRGFADLNFPQTLVCRTGAEIKNRLLELNLPVNIKETPHPLLGHMRSLKADIIQVHEARGAYWATIEHFLRKTPYIITRRLPRPLSDSAFTRRAYRNAAALTGVSNDTTRSMSNQLGLKAETLLDAYTTHTISHDEAREIREQIGGGPVIGHVGELSDEHKGQSILIKAFHQLLNDWPDARLLLLGQGSDRAYFETLAKGDQRIIFAGFQKEIGTWMSVIDILVSPSRIEGLGNVVLDAMALGIPVIASNAGGLPELTADGRGLPVDSLDPAEWTQAIHYLLINENVRRDFVEKAQKFALHNDIEEMTKNFLNLYRRILGVS